MIKINLLPVKRSKKRDAATRELAVGGVVVGVVLLGLYIWYAVMSSKLSAVDQMIEKSQADIARIEQDIVKVGEFKKKKRELEQKLEVIDDLKAKKIGPVKMLDELAANLPKRVWLSSFEEKSGSMIIEGGAAGNDELGDFMSYLMKRSKFFSNITLIFAETAPPEKAAPSKEAPTGPTTPFVKFKLNGAAQYGTIAVAPKEKVK